MDDASFGPAPANRHVQSLLDKLRSNMRLGGPADDQAAPDVDDHGDEERTGVGGHLRYVRDPEFVGARGLEVAVYQVRCRARCTA